LPFDVSYSKVKSHILGLQRQVKTLAANNPLSAATHLAQQASLAELTSKLEGLEALAACLKKANADLTQVVDANQRRAEACTRAHAVQLDAQQMALRGQLTSQQVSQLATKENIIALFAAHDNKRACSPSPSPPSSDAEEEARPEEQEVQKETLLSYDKMQESLAALEAANKVGLRANSSVPHDSHTVKRLPDLPKPSAYSGSSEIVVEDKLFAFERYLQASKSPVHLVEVMLWFVQTCLLMIETI